MTQFSFVPDISPTFVNPDLFGDQRVVDHVRLSDGRIAVVWTGTQQLDYFYYEYNVYGALLDADGQIIGDAFQINSYTQSDQVLPSIAALESGGFVVTWESYGQEDFADFETADYGVYQQVFDASGQPVGAETVVNTSVDGYQGDSLVLGLPGGGHVVFWNHYNYLSRENLGTSAYFRVYDAAGQPVSRETEIPFTNSVEPTFGPLPFSQVQSVVLLPDGRFAALVWNGLSTTEISIFEPDGTPVSQFPVTINGQMRMTALPYGNILIADYVDARLDGWYGPTGDIEATIYAPDGSVVVPAFTVNQLGEGGQYIEDIVVLPDGNLLFVWEDVHQVTTEGRIFAPDGTAISDEFVLIPHGMDAQGVNLTVAPDGRLTLTYETDIFSNMRLDNEVVTHSFDISLLTQETTLTDLPDTLVAGAQDDIINAFAGDDTINGGAGNDYIQGGQGNDSLIGGPGDDLILGAEGNDTLIGGDGNDGLYGSSGDSTISGGNGHDFILTGIPVRGLRSADWHHQIDGGTGNDTIVVQSGSSTIHGGAGHDWIISRGGEVFGGEGNDYIVSGSAHGGAGDDTIYGSGYSGQTGGDGYDILIVRDAVLSPGTGEIGIWQRTNPDGYANPDPFVRNGELSGFEEYHFLAGRSTVNEFYGGDADEIVTWEHGGFRAQGGGGDDLFRSLERGVFIADNVLHSNVEIDAGAGNDTIFGGYGRDTFEGGTGSDLILGGRAGDVLAGGDGDDTLSGEDGADTFVLGGAGSYGGHDVITDFEFGQDIVDISRLTGSTGMPALSEAEVALAFSTASDQPTGALVVFPDGSSVMFEGVSAAELAAMYPDFIARPDPLVGTSGDDMILGNHYDNVIDAGAGDDTMVGGPGDDSLVGGAGADVAVIPVSVSVVSVRPTETGGGLIVGSPFGDDTIDGSVESIEFSDGILSFAELALLAHAGPTAFSDALTGTRGADVIDALAGHDTIDGLGGADSLTGGLGDDSLLGGAGFDTLIGGEGHDTLEGGDHADYLLGGAGGDRLFGGNGADLIHGGAGWDRIDGGDGADRIFGGDGNDGIYAGANYGYTVDGVEGGAGDDTIYGEIGFDLLIGGAGNDELNGGGEADNLYGGDGNDVLRGGTGFDRLFGGDGNDYLSDLSGYGGMFGGRGDDFLYGGEDGTAFFGGLGNDRIRAGGGDDRISGNAGFDRIDAGAGNDTIFGDFNADTFFFEDGHGVDILGDFDALNALEKIDFSGLSTINSLDDLNLGSATAGAATQSGANVVIDTGGGNQITLNGVRLADLDATDFIF